MRWFVILFLLLDGLAGWFLYQVMLAKEEQQLQRHISLLSTAYNAVVNSYRLATQTLYEEIIHRPTVMDLIRAGANSEGEAKDLARGRLYRLLYPTYDRLTQHNLRQFHFHLPNGDSYLRFHRPERYGDNLLAVRPSLRIITQQHKPVFGFEAGRVYSGFRYLYPIMDGDQYLGSVETSLSFQAIEKELVRVSGDNLFSLILRKDVLLDTVFDSEKSVYLPTQLNPDYIYEDLGVRELGLPTPLNPLIKILNEQLRTKSQLAGQMRSNEYFAHTIQYDGAQYAITFMPILDVSQQQAGYLISYSKDSLLSTFSQEFYAQFTATSLMLLLLVGAMWRSEKARHALHESQVTLKGIFNNAPIGISLLNPQGYYLKANTLFLKMFGYTWNELKKKRCLEINHSNYLEISEKMMQEILSGKRDQWNLDKRFIRKDGSIFWGNHWLAALKDEQGHCVALICIVSDLTARKKAEESLRKLSRAVEQSHNTIVITNLEGTIEFVNPAFTYYSGYSAEEAIGQNPKILKSGNQDSFFYERLWETLLRGDTWHGEFLNKRKDHSFYWEAATISPIKDEEGITTHYVAIKEDITLRKVAELELQQTNQQLQRVNQEKNEFLGIAAHDLKNPLSAIKGLAEEIGQDYDQMTREEVIEDANKIHIASQRMFMLITNLLDINAIESEKVNIHAQVCDISSIIEVTLADYQDRAAHKQMRLEFLHEILQYKIWADPEVMRQVLDNLVSNAIKYSPPGALITTRLYADDHHAYCAITDQGPGFSIEDQAKLFGKFSRLSAQPTGNEHSTGLGLFIVKKLVEAMDGKVWCESVPQQGSTFILQFSLLSD